MVEVSRDELEPVFNFYREIDYVELNDELEMLMSLLRRNPQMKIRLNQREARSYLTFKRRMEQSQIEIESSEYTH